MSPKLQHGLTRTFGAVIAVTLTVIAFVVALLAYGVQVRQIEVACRDSLGLVGDILPLYPTPQYEPRAKIDVIMTHLFHPGLVVELSENQIRYEARWRPAVPESTDGYIVKAEPRTGIPSALGGRSTFDRSALALAALAGYTGSWSQFGDDEIGIVADPATLTAIAVRTFTIFALVTIVLIAIAFSLGRAMSRHALRRLSDVAEALERFARGDLSVQAIESNRKDELGRLALAYNGAIEMVTRALAQRDRADTQMRQFIADASHQLRTPLTVVNGFISVLRKDDFAKSPEVARALATMDQQSAHMTSLIAKLLLFERWDGGAESILTKTDIAELVERIALPIAGAHPARDVRVVLQPDAFASVDVDDLQHAIANLVTNALTYAPAGTITVTVHRDETAVLLSVSDQGPGIDAAEIDHVFDRFYRGRRRDVPGSGLGLAIAKRAVERSNGTLSVRTNPGGGSTFTITLPALERVDEPRASHSPPSLLTEA